MKNDSLTDAAGHKDSDHANIGGSSENSGSCENCRSSEPERKPSLCFVNRCYWPDSEATGQLLTELAESLVDDFDVHVICGQPNSPTTDDYVRRGVEQRNGVSIHRLKHTQFAKRIPAGRMINLVSFARATASYLRRRGLTTDVMVSLTDPFLLPPVVARHAAASDAKFVAYLQDIYPDVAIAIGKAKSGPLTNAIRKRLQAAYHAADRVIVLGRCMSERLTAAPWAIDASKIRIIENWANTDSITPIPIQSNSFRQKHSLDENFVVMHSGNMGLTQRLDVVLDAVASDHWPDRAVLLLVGDGASRNSLQTSAAQFFGPATPKIRFLPYQPRHELAHSLSAADVHLISMDAAVTGCLCPSKLYGILAAGRPVIAIADAATELSRVVSEHGVGICVGPGDPEAINRAIHRLADNPTLRQEMGQRARKLAVDHYDRRLLMGRVKDLLREVSVTQPIDSQIDPSIGTDAQAISDDNIAAPPDQPKSSGPSEIQSISR